MLISKNSIPHAFSSSCVRSQLSKEARNVMTWPRLHVGTSYERLHGRSTATLLNLSEFCYGYNRLIVHSSKYYSNVPSIDAKLWSLADAVGDGHADANLNAMKQAYSKGSYKHVLNIWVESKEALTIGLAETVLITAEKASWKPQQVDQVLETYFKWIFSGQLSQTTLSPTLNTGRDSTTDYKYENADIEARIEEFLEMCERLRTGYLCAFKLVGYIRQHHGDLAIKNDWYISVAALCSKSNKWRTLLDLLQVIQRDNCILDEKILKMAIITCCQDTNSAGKAVKEAYSMFQYMISREMARDEELYLRLLHTLNREDLFTEAEQVWLQLRIDSSLTKMNSRSMSSGSSKLVRTANHFYVQLTDPLYASYITTLLGLGHFDNAINVYKRVFERYRNPMHSYMAFFGGLRRMRSKGGNGDMTEGIMADLSEKYSITLSSQQLTGNIRRLLVEKEFVPAFNFLLDLNEKELALVPIKLLNEVFHHGLSQGLIEEIMTLLKHLRGMSQNVDIIPQDDMPVFDETLTDQQTEAVSMNALIELQTNKWVKHTINALSDSGDVDTALDLMKSEGSYLTDDSFSALLSLLIKNDYVSLSLQLLRDRYYSKNGETRPSLPYGVAFNSVKLLIRHGYYESLPPLFQVLMDLKWERQTAPLIKGMDMTNMPSTEYLEFRDLYVAAFRFLEHREISVYNTSRIAETVSSLLEQQLRARIQPSWTQFKSAIRIFSCSNSSPLPRSILISNSKLLLRLFSLRRDSENYICDEKMYDLAMKACIVLGKWELTVDLFGELLEEKKRLSPFIFETVITNLVESQDDGQQQQLHIGAIADVYRLMVTHKTRPTTKTESMLLKYLPKDLKLHLQRESSTAKK